MAVTHGAGFVLQLPFDACVGDEDAVIDVVLGKLGQRVCVKLHNGRGAGAQIAQAVDAHAGPRLEIGAAAADRVPGLQLDLLVLELRIQEDEQVLQGQELHPAERLFVVGALVVALHGDAGDAGVAQPAEGAHGLVQHQGVEGAAVEEVAGQEDEVDFGSGSWD